MEGNFLAASMRSDSSSERSFSIVMSASSSSSSGSTATAEAEDLLLCIMRVSFFVSSVTRMGDAGSSGCWNLMLPIMVPVSVTSGMSDGGDLPVVIVAGGFWICYFPLEEGGISIARRHGTLLF